MVAFHYPPDHTSSGVLRTLKFSKYMPEFGWDPVVVTVRESCYEKTDPALMQQVPAGTQVWRTRAINMKETFSVFGKYLRFYTIPDRFVGWLPFAVATGLKIIRRGGIDVLYSTSPLPTAHLVASILKSWTGIPWVADFRDPWTEPELEPNPRALLFRLECYLERHVLLHADRTIFSTAQLRQYVATRASAAANGKAVVIPNGYDEEDFGAFRNCEPDPMPVRFTHTGLVDESYRSPRRFLEALAELLQSGQIPRNQIRVDFLGGGSYLRSSAFRSLVKSLRLENVISVLDRVSYRECLERQAKSHALLLLQCGDDTRTLIPAKAFEYLRVGRPILALAPPSASSELFEEVGGATVVHPDDRQAIRRAIRELFVAAREGNWRADVKWSLLRNYTRRKLTGRLARELDQVCEEK